MQVVSETQLKAPFKTVFGKRVVIPFPKVDEVTESGVILTPNSQKEKEQDMLDSYLRVPVIQVGGDCERLVKGDLIFIPPRVVQPGRSDMLITEDGNKYLIINEQDVVGIW